MNVNLIQNVIICTQGDIQSVKSTKLVEARSLFFFSCQLSPERSACRIGLSSKGTRTVAWGWEIETATHVW